MRLRAASFERFTLDADARREGSCRGDHARWICRVLDDERRWCGHVCPNPHRPDVGSSSAALDPKLRFRYKGVLDESALIDTSLNSLVGHSMNCEVVVDGARKENRLQLGEIWPDQLRGHFSGQSGPRICQLWGRKQPTGASKLAATMTGNLNASYQVGSLAMTSVTTSTFSSLRLCSGTA